MNFRLDQQVVVVTGGAGRIGAAFCRAIAAQGGTAVIADTAPEAAGRLAAELCAAHGPAAALALTVDITSTRELDQAIATLQARFGRIDAVVNNAYPRNQNYGRKFEDVTYEDFADNVSRHLGGYFLTAQRFALHFKTRGRGQIVNLGSIYGVAAPRFEIYAGTPITMPVEYAAIKAGVLHLTRYLAQYLKPHGVRVNAISPGGVFADQPETFVQSYNQHTLGHRMLSPEDVTGTLIFLLSDASAHLTGQNLVVDDGWTL